MIIAIIALSKSWNVSSKYTYFIYCADKESTFLKRLFWNGVILTSPLLK